MEPGATKKIGKITIVMPTNSSPSPTRSSARGQRGQQKNKHSDHDRSRTDVRVAVIVCSEARCRHTNLFSYDDSAGATHDRSDCPVPLQCTILVQFVIDSRSEARYLFQ